MKRTKHDRVSELNQIIKNVTDGYEFATMPRDYAPYCLLHNGSVYAGGYFKEVLAMANRMAFAACQKLPITFDLIFGCGEYAPQTAFVA